MPIMVLEENKTCDQKEELTERSDFEAGSQKHTDEGCEDSKNSESETEKELSEINLDENLKDSSEQELFLDLCPGAIDELDADFTVLDDCEDTKEHQKVEENVPCSTKEESHNKEQNGNAQKPKIDVKEQKSIKNDAVSKNNSPENVEKKKLKIKEASSVLNQKQISVKEDKEEIKIVKIQTAKSAEVRKNENKSKDGEHSRNNKGNDRASEGDSLIITASDMDLNDMSICSARTEKSVSQGQKASNSGNNTAPSKKRAKVEVKTETAPKTDKFIDNTVSEEKFEMKDVAVDEKAPKKKDVPVSAKQKSNLRCLWVANISKTLKANNLKQFCLKFGKVQSAKIVTDGKNLFGYVVFEKHTDASECMRKLDGTIVEGEKISLSFTKPQIKPKNVEAKEIKQALPAKEKSHIKEERKTIKKLCDNDPLTTKFVTESKRKRSYSRENDIHREYIREKRERERLRRRIMEQEEQQREERRRQRRREEEQRQLEWKLKQERKKLELERELLEKERKEMQRLEQERRKIEEEKQAVSRQKEKLEAEIRNARKLESKKRKDAERSEDKRKKVTVKSKISESYKPPSEERRYQDHYKPKHSQDYPRAPPAPKLSEPVKIKPSRGYEHRRPEIRSDFSPKIDSYERKYECRKIEPIFTDRKAEFAGRKVVSDRFDIKPHREFRRDSCERRFSSDFWKVSAKPAGKPWEAPVHQDMWKVGSCAAGIPPVRHEATVPDTTYVTGRCDGGYYYHHLPSMATDFTRFEQYSQSNRKY